MKRLLSLVLAMTLCAACSDDFLSPRPLSEVTTGNFYTSEADVEKAVSAVYSGMRSWPSDIYIYLSEVRSPNYIGVFHDAQRDWWDITAFDVKPESNTLQDVWGGLYQMINRANVVLEHIDGVEFRDPALKAQYTAEARFLRGFAYFQLVRLFGRVPLVTEPITPEEGRQIGQSEPAEVYTFITDEMSAVMDQLPPSYPDGQAGRVTRWAAKGILARVYLTMAGHPLQQRERLEDARTLLQEVIAQEGGDVRWTDDYDALFTEENDNQFALLEVQFVSGGFGAGSSFPVEVVPNVHEDTIPFGGNVSANRLALSDHLLTAYELDDARFDATIDTLYVTNSIPADTGNTPYIHKFIDPGITIVSRGDWPINFPVLRTADVFLMQAEVVAELAGGPTPDAVALLNRVRARAGLDPVSPASKAEFDQALERERRIELVGEGSYWFDLVRRGRAVEVMNGWFQESGQGIQIDEHDLVYPIPQSEIDIFPGLYQQNPGY
jgi:starch-binding outer membrane protein, SusD/RagB family